MKKIIYEYVYISNSIEFKQWQKSNNVIVHKTEFDIGDTAIGIVVLYSEAEDEITS